MNKTILPDRMIPAEVADELEVTTQTLEKWRCNGTYALPWYKIGRRVFYSRKDLETFIESRKHPGTVAA